MYALGWRVRPAEELEIIEARATDGAFLAHRDAARRAVDEHERRNTLFPAS